MADLHWLDILVFTTFVIFSVGIGVYHGCTGGKQRTSAEFLMGDRKLQMLPTMLSLLVSYVSAILVLGATAEMFTRGTMAAIWEVTAKSIGMLLAERFLTPWIYYMKLVSANEYFERRYGCKSVRMVGSLLSILNSIVYMGVSIYAPSVALEAASGLPSHWSIPIMASICVIYTALGGIKAVVWTDVFQFLVMCAGLLAVMVKVILLTDHADVLAIAKNQSRLEWFNIDPNPQTRHTVWGFIFGLSWMWFFMYGTAQPSIQRICAVRSLSHARWIVLLNIPFSILMFTASFVVGIFIFVYFYDRKCDPLSSEMVNSPNQILVVFVLESFWKYPGFLGLFIATLYSGGFSSVSSSLSAATANAWEDLLKHRVHASELKAACINKILVILYGVLATAVSFIVLYTGGPVMQIAASMLAATTAPVGAMFLLGGIRWLRKYVEPIGACCGGVAGLAINVWISVGRAFIKGTPPLPPVETSGCAPPFNQTLINSPIIVTTNHIGIEQLYRVSYVWTAPIGVVTTFIVTLVVSRIALCFYKPEMDNIPEDLFLTTKHLCTFGEKETTGSENASQIEMK